MSLKEALSNTGLKMMIVYGGLEMSLLRFVSSMALTSRAVVDESALRRVLLQTMLWAWG